MTSIRIFDSAFRLAALVMALMLFAFLMVAGAAVALAAADLKKDVVTLTGENLTVGDIFDNAGKNAAFILGPAPAPGKEMVLNTSTLIRIASALELQWQPASNTDQIVIRRAATLIPTIAVLDAIKTKIAEKVVIEKFALDTGTMNLDITLPNDQPGTMDVTDVTYNQRTNRFEATIVAPSVANPVKKLTVTGSVKAMTTIPVLKNALRNGDMIGEGDIEMVDFFTSDIQGNTMLKASDVIGMTPRRMAMAGKPINAVDLQSPQLVDRGQGVTIIFKAGPLNLTAMGKALQAGARGDVIHVVNNSSNRTVDAIISGEREVTVKE
ncbi:MAG: flgA [Micavibrio sp.]|nr:flgA [Micavibrio sp.]